MQHYSHSSSSRRKRFLALAAVVLQDSAPSTDGALYVLLGEKGEGRVLGNQCDPRVIGSRFDPLAVRRPKRRYCCVRRLPDEKENNMAVPPRRSADSAKRTTKEIREWATGAGFTVSSRGRISVEIEQAFHDARAKMAQAEPEPVKKTASKKAIAETTAVKKKAVKKVPGEKAPAKRAASKDPAKKTTKEIREWAIGEGLEVSSRGRIPAEIEQAFDDAQAKKAPVKSAPAKKTAAKKTAAKKTAAAAPVKRIAESKAPAEKKIGAAKAAAEKPTGKKAAVKKPVTAKIPVTKAVESKAPAKTTNKEIRAWAIADGRQVSFRGRIPAEIEQAFHDAQAKKVPAKTAPAEKKAAKKAAAKNTAAAAAPVKRVAASKTSAEKKVVATKTAATKTAGKKTVTAKATSEKTAVKKTFAAKAPAKRDWVSKAPAKKSSREIREWAIGAGHEVSSRGRISVEIERAFHDAQAEMPVA